jgi:CRISPR-associated protein Cas2
MDDPDWYLIAYDIAEPRRLQRLHRRLRRDAVALQESVFLVNRSRGGIVELMNELAGLIHRQQDDLRAYPIPDPGEIWLRGKGALDGNLLQPGGRTKPPAQPTAPGGWWRRLLGRGD